MIFTMRLRLRMNDGALVRVLRLIEHRSARVLEVSVRTDRQRDALPALEVEVTAEARIPAAVLAEQVRSQYDVDEVSAVSDTGPGDADAAPACGSAAGQPSRSVLAGRVASPLGGSAYCST